MSFLREGTLREIERIMLSRVANQIVTDDEYFDYMDRIKLLNLVEMEEEYEKLKRPTLYEYRQMLDRGDITKEELESKLTTKELEITMGLVTKEGLAKSLTQPCEKKENHG